MSLNKEYLMSLKKEDESYIDEDGVYYDSAISVIFSKYLEFCTCGNQRAVAKYILDGLKLLRNARLLNYDMFNIKQNSYFGSSSGADFFWLWAESRGFTEHGSCIPGWLTDEGVDLIECLEWALVEKEKS